MMQAHDPKSCEWCRRNRTADFLGTLLVLAGMLVFLWLLFR